MADRGMIYSAPMVRSLLAGRKTQTRRIIKPQPTRPECWAGTWVDADREQHAGHMDGERAICRFEAGDRLWVRETWQTGCGEDGPQIAYQATADRHDIDAWDGEDEGAGPSFNYERCPCATWSTWLPDLLNRAEGTWRPSIHMPRWASRLTLAVTDVRVERLQDIGAADAIDEGIDDFVEDGERRRGAASWDGLSRADRLAVARTILGDPTNAYRALWDSLHGPDAWSANPWVAAPTFAVHHANIDAVPERSAA